MHSLYMCYCIASTIYHHLCIAHACELIYLQIFPEEFDIHKQMLNIHSDLQTHTTDLQKAPCKYINVMENMVKWG